MYSHNVYVQSKSSTGVIYKGLLDTIESLTFDKLIIAVAYITYGGCTKLVDSLENLPNWGEIDKFWFTSFDHGITEPGALNFIQKLPNSTVRIHNAEQALNSKLRPKDKFHAKLYVFENSDTESLALYSTSSNLTVSGLYLNFEQATSDIFVPPISDENIGKFEEAFATKEILEHEFQLSDELNQDLLERYSDLRPKYIVHEEDEDDGEPVRRITEPEPEFDISKAAALANARNFWIDINYVTPNLGEGKSGNQIDLQRGSRVFFGFGAGQVPTNTVLGPVILRYNGVETECNMRFGNNSMDKLNLPTPDDPGPPTYSERTLIFTKYDEGKYDLRVEPISQDADYRIKSTEQNTHYVMHGGREFGVFS